MSETKKTKKRTPRKWSVGKLVPVEMPENSVMTEINAEIKEIEAKEEKFYQQKTKVSSYLFLASSIWVFICSIIWIFFSGIFPSGLSLERAAELRVVVSLLEVVVLGVLILCFELNELKNKKHIRKEIKRNFFRVSLSVSTLLLIVSLIWQQVGKI